MRKFLVLTALVFVCFSCDVRPLTVLNKEEMAAVLVDIHVAEAVTGKKLTFSKHAEKRAYFESVFQKHHITFDDFQKSIDWYSRHPKIFAEVYSNVLTELQNKEIDVKNYVFHPEDSPERKKQIDSLNLWVQPVKIEASFIDAEMLRFEIMDSILFAPSDKYVIRFIKRMNADSLPSAEFKFYLQYSDGVLDSVIYQMSQKKATYRYTVTMMAKDTLTPIGLFGTFYSAHLDSTSVVTFDSIVVMRYFNPLKHPLDSLIPLHLDSLRKINGIRVSQKNSSQSQWSKSKDEIKDTHIHNRLLLPKVLKTTSRVNPKK